MSDVAVRQRRMRVQMYSRGEVSDSRQSKAKKGKVKERKWSQKACVDADVDAQCAAQYNQSRNNLRLDESRR